MDDANARAAKVAGEGMAVAIRAPVELEYVLAEGDVGVDVAIHTGVGGREERVVADTASSKGGVGKFPSDSTTVTDGEDDDKGAEFFVSSTGVCFAP